MPAYIWRSKSRTGNPASNSLCFLYKHPGDEDYREKYLSFNYSQDLRHKEIYLSDQYLDTSHLDEILKARRI